MMSLKVNIKGKAELNLGFFYKKSANISSREQI